MVSSVNLNSCQTIDVTPDVFNTDRNLEFECLYGRANVLVDQLAIVLRRVYEVELAGNLIELLHTLVVKVSLHSVNVTQSLTVFELNLSVAYEYTLNSIIGVVRSTRIKRNQYCILSWQW